MQHNTATSTLRNMYNTSQTALSPLRQQYIAQCIQYLFRLLSAPSVTSTLCNV